MKPGYQPNPDGAPKILNDSRYNRHMTAIEMAPVVKRNNRVNGINRKYTVMTIAKMTRTAL